MATTPRLLLSGDVLGRLSLLYKRFTSVNKSAGPFDAILCVGQFFPDTTDQLQEFMDYIDGRREIPIPTYFIGDYGVASPKVLSAAANEPGNLGFKMDGLKVCPNLYWLKGGGSFTLHGLSVAYLSGRQSPSGHQFGKYTQDDVDALRAFVEEPGIPDIFLTNEWPKGVTNRVSSEDVPSETFDSSCCDSTVAELVVGIKPRYHIAGSKGVFYAREPYANEDALHVTRFFGLAPVGNKEKQKFMHAISPTPSSTMSASEISLKPPNTTLCPYKIDDNTASRETNKRPGDSNPEAQYWRYDVKKRGHGAPESERFCFKFLSSGSCPRGENCSFRHDAEAREQSMRGVCFDFLNKGKCERGSECQFLHNLVDEGEGVSRKKPKSGGAIDIRSKECWFCLSSPHLESHLIISVGEHLYCAMAKGPLVDDHVLLIPIEHSSSTLSLTPDGQRELFRFQCSLRTFCKTQGKEVVFFEWITKRGMHANLQAIPIPQTRASAIKTIFNLAAKRLGFDFETIKNDDASEGRELLISKFDGQTGFFYVELPDGTVLGHIVEENENFPFQFGREVLSGLLKIPDKADWRNCKVSKDEEVIMVEAFKSQFKAFDPNEA
ncbi:zinc finger CCCH domain-containing protein 64 isoform X1 [Silene latifolia]|uniref:zinc finger CCCH domain-containing protein 64 isoform X1 n=1 Tax=Silene latifolia TaxID=37657 RepID=UPI003D76E9B6